MIDPFERFFQSLPAQHPFIYVDVGAMGGLASHWQPLSNLMTVVAFEPDPRECSKLCAQKNFKVFPYFLFSRRKAVKFLISQQAGLSSCYTPNFDVLKYFPQVERYTTVEQKEFSGEEVSSLDELFEQRQLYEGDFIKLDTQGSELEIIQGGKKFFRNFFGAEIEVEFASLYQDQPLFRDIDRQMDELGFQIVDLRRAFWKRKVCTAYQGHGQLVFGDALYFRKLPHWINDLKALPVGSQVRSKILKSVITCLVYRLPDYALDIVQASQEQGLIEDVFSREIQGWIQQHVKRRSVSTFPGREFLAKLLRKGSEVLRPQSHLEFSDGDRFLGNIRSK